MKRLLFLFIVFSIVLFPIGTPKLVLASACDTSQCDCTTKHPQTQPCSPAACTINGPLAGKDNAGNNVTVFNCGTPNNPILNQTSPSNWLQTINPGPNIPSGSSLGVNFGMGFILGNVVPFLVSGTFFLLIVLSLIFLIIGGIMWITSGGNKEGMAKAKNTVTYALLGLALGLGSFIILKILGGFFNVDLILAPMSTWQALQVVK